MRNPWMAQNPHRPKENRRQAQFLAYLGKEALYGGAAGGGKSSALLMAAAQFVEIPGYSALLLRRSFRDLNQPDALIPRSREWWGGKEGVHWSHETKRWTFPSGATIGFGYLDHPNDVYQYQGAAFQFVGWDELTQFPEEPYRYMFSRLRRPAVGPLSRVPLRMRAASNPGGIGAAWVKKRFVSAGGKFFVPAFLKDNQYLDARTYLQSMANLTREQRLQLLAGSWEEFEGGRFHREWFRRWWTEAGPEDAVFICLDDGRKIPHSMCWQFVVCDPAASEKDSADYTAIGAFMVTPARDLLILEMVRERLDIDDIVPRIADVCRAYSPAWVGIEAVAFQVAILRAAQRHRDIPAARPFEPEGKGKLVRATPAIIRCEAGQVFLPDDNPGNPQHPWIDDFVGELVQFTGNEDEDAYCDQVDCLAYAVQGLERYGLAGGPVVVEPEELEVAEQRFNGYYGRER